MMSEELQVTAKRLETRHIDALFDILLVNTHLPPPSPYQCCYGFSNNIESNKQQH